MLIAIACLLEVCCDRRVPYFEIYFAIYVFRMGLRLVDLEGSLDAGYDRQTFGLTVLGNAMTIFITLNIQFLAFKQSCLRLSFVYLQAFFVSVITAYGQLLYGKELVNLKAQTIILLSSFPLLCFAALFQTLSLENAREAQISSLQVESQYLYVLDLLQESIAIIESFDLTENKIGLSLEYVNNCFLAHFQPFIENCSSPSNEQGETVESEGESCRRFLQAKIFYEYQQ